MRAAIYARKSTDQSGNADDQKSVTRQTQHAVHPLRCAYSAIAAGGPLDSLVEAVRHREDERGRIQRDCWHSIAPATSRDSMSVGSSVSSGPSWMTGRNYCGGRFRRRGRCLKSCSPVR